VIVVLAFFGLMVPFYKRSDSNNPFFGSLTRNLSFTLNHFILRLKVIPKGLENIPKKGKVVFFANHKSYTDPFVVLQLVKRNLAYAVKKGVYQLPLIGLWLQAMNCFMVDRDNDRDTVKRLMKAIKTVEKGQSMLIFPEGGTKNRDNELIEQMKHGAFKIGLFILSFLCVISSAYIGSNIIGTTDESVQNALGVTTNWMTWVFIIVVIYFLMYLFYAITTSIARQKEEKLKY
jgi:1-acyl-sn-glycerol-3-phosphate acyltransferase